MDFTAGDIMERGDRRSGDYGLWIFALVILALFFLWGRDGKRDHNYGGAEGVLPAFALGNAMHHKPYNGGCNSELRDWDILRDNLREFANVREEVRIVGHQNAMENAKYFYEQRGAMDRGFFEQARLTDRNNHDAQIGFKNVEIGNLVQTKDILARIDKLENGMKEDKIHELTSKVNFFETVHAIRGHGAIPAYPVAGPAPLASGFVHSAPPCFA